MLLFYKFLSNAFTKSSIFAILKNKRMKQIILFLVGILFLTACQESKKPTTEQSVAIEEKVAEQHFGKKIDAQNAINAKDLLTILNDKDSVFVKVKGEVDAVCKIKGCWMSFPLSDEIPLRIRFKDYDFFVPLNCENHTTIVEGWAYKTILSVEELKHYAEDAEYSQEEIDAIVEPETEYTFMADGVLMYE